MTWQIPHWPRLQSSPGVALLWLNWALYRLPSLPWKRHPIPREGVQATASCSNRHPYPHNSHLGLPLPFSPLPCSPALHPLTPLGSNRSSHGQNTISFNKLNLLRLLITSGVGSDQRERRLQPPGVPVVVVGGKGKEHTEGDKSPPGLGNPSHSNRSSGQVSILLDKNRKEGAYPSLLLAHKGNSCLPGKE